MDELRERLEKLDLGDTARKEVERELRRLGRTASQSAEYQVIRTYLEWVAELPWNARTDDKIDLHRAEEILAEDHYGLEDVKDRVLEFLAVRKLQQDRFEGNDADADPDGETTPDEPQELDATDEATAEPAVSEEEPPSLGEDEIGSKGPILLFAGPPGVGKTSIARSIARSVGRKYVRISLGGARDEADIRGHRRTYVGSMPGRIIQGVKEAGTKNPVFLLDEVDKLGVSFQGDPSSALLEVLDPAQNRTFIDHYLGVPFDLSEVLFVATANSADRIPAPMLDRMELVEFRGYTEKEKLEIARRYLAPRQMRDSGLLDDELEIEDDAILAVIRKYTHEAGVRQLEREMGKLARKVARQVASGASPEMTITPKKARKLLGQPRVHQEQRAADDAVGVATGMFYTAMGGDIMFVEASVMPGDGELVLTGQLGDVMKESARAALSYAKSNVGALGIADSALDKREIHIHVPAGAVPKDGPSAGITMATALIFGGLGAEGSQRRGNDGRAHADGPGAAHRRRQGEGVGRGAGGHPRDHSSGREPDALGRSCRTRCATISRFTWWTICIGSSSWRFASRTRNRPGPNKWSRWRKASRSRRARTPETTARLKPLWRKPLPDVARRPCSVPLVSRPRFGRPGRLQSFQRSCPFRLWSPARPEASPSGPADRRSRGRRTSARRTTRSLQFPSLPPRRTSTARPPPCCDGCPPALGPLPRGRRRRAGGGRLRPRRAPTIPRPGPCFADGRSVRTPSRRWRRGRARREPLRKRSGSAATSSPRRRPAHPADTCRS